MKITGMEVSIAFIIIIHKIIVEKNVKTRELLKINGLGKYGEQTS